MAELGRMFGEIGQTTDSGMLSDFPTPQAAPEVSGGVVAKELQNEKRKASTSALLTGGQGLLDDPKTTRAVLLGA